MIKVGKQKKAVKMVKVSEEAMKDLKFLRLMANSKSMSIKLPKNTLKVLSTKITFGTSGCDYSRNVVTMKKESIIVLFRRK